MEDCADILLLARLIMMENGTLFNRHLQKCQYCSILQVNTPPPPFSYLTCISFSIFKICRWTKRESKSTRRSSSALGTFSLTRSFFFSRPLLAQKLRVLMLLIYGALDCGKERKRNYQKRSRPEKIGDGAQGFRRARADEIKHEQDSSTRVKEGFFFSL